MRLTSVLVLFLTMCPATLDAAETPASPATAGATDEAEMASTQETTVTWGYTAGLNGPEEWSQLNRKEWGACTGSSQQSPLHIVDNDYDCGGKCVYDPATWSGEPMNVVHGGAGQEVRRLTLNGLKPIIEGQIRNDGHTLLVQVPEAHEKMYTIFEGRKYELLRYQFHRIAEHKVNGYQMPLEIHLVHKGAQDNIMIVAVFFEEADNANLFLNGVGFKAQWLPVELGESKRLPRPVNPLGVVDDMSVYNDAATDQMRNSQVLSLSLQLTGWALSPRTISAQKEFKDAWDLVADTDEARARHLREVYIFGNPAPAGYKDEMDRPPLEHTQLYHEIHLKHHPYYREMLYANNYYDIFVFDTIGNLIYSVYKELDYATNFQTTGRYGASGLGKAFRAAMANPTEVNEIPWEPYEPSYGALASFVSTGIVEGGQTIGVFCIQLPPEAIAEAIALGLVPASALNAGRRRLLQVVTEEEIDAAAQAALAWKRSSNDEACAKRLNQMRIAAGCANGGRRRLLAGTGGAGNKCPSCPTLREEGSANLDYWTYEGSLTAPPCTEGVKWVVVKQRTPATSLQIGSFPFANNFRPPQPIFARKIHSNSEPAWEWGYTLADGPHAWAANGYSFCGGDHQSPINIDTTKVREYKHFDFIARYAPQYNLYVINTGRSIEVQLRLTKAHISMETGVQASFEKQMYYLYKIQFHKKSEHTIDGETSALEAQFYHRQEGEADLADQLVVTILYDLTSECDAQLDALNWDNLPQTRNTIGKHVPDAFLVEDLMPLSRRYYSYGGSLTVPPCSPGVQWVILQEKRRVCQRQLDRFPMENVRPVQPIDDRYVHSGSFRASDRISDIFWDWGYSHQYRPMTWGRYYSACNGAKQSPVNIIRKDVVDHGHGPDQRRLELHWQTMCGIRTRNNGHTILVDMPAGHSTFEGVDWRVKQFHFHAPSEHQIDGHSFPFEMQIIHVDANLQDRNLIISILFEKGAQNNFLEELDWYSLPPQPRSKAEEETHAIHHPVSLNQMIQNKNSDLQYYTYDGSLTTPPCTEGVKWVVLLSADHIDEQQLLHYYNVLGNANFRTPQTLNGRVISKNSPSAVNDESSLWGYENHNGPATWSSSGFPDCDYEMQSPIDIIPNNAIRNDNYALVWEDWQPITGAMKLKMTNDNNRNFIVDGFGKHHNKLTFEGQFYYLQKIMFHKRSETRFNGAQSEFEVHFVHKNEVDMYLYVVQLYDMGDENLGLNKLMWSHLSDMVISPQEQNMGQRSKSMMVNDKFSPMELIDLMGLDKTEYPNGPLYYHYDGSMSTPPCLEGVTWVVLEQKAYLSPAQYAQYPLDNTARPVMPLGTRKVKFLSSINVNSLYEASRQKHQSGELMHNADHNMVISDGSSMLAMTRSSQIHGLKLLLMKFGKDPATNEALKEFESGWKAMGNNFEERATKLRDLYIFNNPNPFGSKDALDRPPIQYTDSYHEIHEKRHPFWRTMLYDNNFYDIFILDQLGNLVYSVYKELDYATNFGSTRGRYGNSGLGEAFRAAMANPDIVNEIDWAPYEPSYGALASFVSTGIVEQGRTIGVFCIQLPPEARSTGSGRRRAPPAVVSSRKQGFEWGYGVENGPLKWGLHVPSCIGFTQSPIVIEECQLIERTKNKMLMHWGFTQGLKIKNTGYTLEVDGLKSSWTEFEGVRYDLESFHFHAASEHLFHGEQYPLEMHLVHTRRHPLPPHKPAPALVIALVFDIGVESPDLKSLFFGDDMKIPKETGQATDLEFPFNPIHFTPYNKNYYSYDGSLTTPPCTEGIRWVVMQSLVTASSKQLASFPFRNNFRNPQPMLQRPVYFLSQQDRFVYVTTTGAGSAVHTSVVLMIGALAMLFGAMQ